MLGLTALAVGIYPNSIDVGLVSAMLRDVTAQAQTVDLYLWHGINGPLLLSLATYALGALMYWKFQLSGAPLLGLKTQLALGPAIRF